MISVAISDLKARLSAHLRAVRRGDVLTILDRRRPIAKIVPLDSDEGWRERTAAAEFSNIEPPPPSGVEPAALAEALAAEHQGQR